MPQEPRTIKCDACGETEIEKDFNAGWNSGWCIINGIGACAPEKGIPIMVKNTQTCLCRECTGKISEFIHSMQEAHK